MNAGRRDRPEARTARALRRVPDVRARRRPPARLTFGPDPFTHNRCTLGG
jgi:hypothetical protein